MTRIVYIAGNGRSGTTLLEGILANDPTTISIGEASRYVLRFAEGTSRCGCGIAIRDCDLWSTIESRLRKEFDDYDPQDLFSRLQEIQKYKNFNKLPIWIDDSNWKEVCDFIRLFYRLVSEVSAKPVILDSSKNVSWLYFLSLLNIAELRPIFLERELSGIADSWKKKVKLPEYPDANNYMPVKSNQVILRSYLKTNRLAKRFRKSHELLVIRYDRFCETPETVLREIQGFAHLSLPKPPYDFGPNHGIGGNPLRFNATTKISIVKPDSGKHLKTWESVLFGTLGSIIKPLSL